MFYQSTQFSWKTGYPIVQDIGQRRFGPPPDWIGPPPPKGCEVFIGKLPRYIFEDELVPLFSRVGKLYELRLMMDFLVESNRSYAFVTYATRADAAAAVRQLSGYENYEIRPRRQIVVEKSFDKRKLYVNKILKTKTKEEVMEEYSKKVNGIVDVTLHKDRYDHKLNRGYAFIEFTSHRAAKIARKVLLPSCASLRAFVDWAEPEPDIDDEIMRQVKVLHVRNFEIRTTPNTIRAVFQNAIKNKVQHVIKMYDYAFIHFYKRRHAEIAMALLQSADIDGSTIEIQWAKPVDRDIYWKNKRNNANAIQCKA